MSRFLKKPQLPDKEVLSVAIGECYLKEYAPQLEKLGVEAIGLNAVAELEPRLRGHADLLLLHSGGNNFFAAKGLRLHNNFNVVNYVNLSGNDAALNSCLIGEFWIGSPQHAAWQPADRRLVPVKQRYTRCSVCIVDEHSIITADRGIARAATDAGLEVLVIEPGHIKLEGFDYGFIGGATFKLAPNKLAFTGQLHTHPDEKRILSFLCQRDIEPVFLKCTPLTDIGSAVLLSQKSEERLPQIKQNFYFV